MSNKITSVTKRDIFNLFINGLDIDLMLGDAEHVNYLYYGCLTEINFLNRLYNLKDMKSSDFHFANAEDDIWQHTENNDDYEFGWIFKDERFPLKDGADEDLLHFLCEVFHPEVRLEKGYWKEFLAEVNRLLSNDDIELYPIKQISNHVVYGWRIKSKAESIYLPFSQKHKEFIDNKKLKFSIRKDCREQIIKAVGSFDETLYMTNETGWHYNSNISEEAFKLLSQYYEPKCYDKNNKYVNAEDLYTFLSGTRPYCVFDAIEVFSKNNPKEPEFSKRINAILSLNKLPYSLRDGIIQISQSIGISDEQIGTAPEVGVTELLQKAQGCYNNKNKEDAVEKLWDAFERLKTIHTDCDKSHSSDIIIDSISKSNPVYIDIFKTEFLMLTKIGNNFRIRHHETDKTEIDDERYYDYFYSRCSALISLILNFEEL